MGIPSVTVEQIVSEGDAEFFEGRLRLKGAGVRFDQRWQADPRVQRIQREVVNGEEWLRSAFAGGCRRARRTRLGVQMSMAQMLDLAERLLPGTPPSPPLGVDCDHPVSDDLICRPDTPVVGDGKKWTYVAGTPLHRGSFWQTNPERGGFVEREILSHGWNPTPTHLLHVTWFHDHRADEEDAQLWENETTKHWRVGAAECLNASGKLPTAICPKFAVKVPGKDPRLINDARWSNLAYTVPKFKLPRVLDFARMLRKDEFWCAADLKSGWLHLPLHPDHAQAFVYTHGDRVMQYRVPAFGDRTAPYAFVRATKTMAEWLLQRKERFALYVDDLGLALGMSYEDALRKQASRLGTCSKLFGWVWGKSKVSPPQREGEFLGFILDTRTCTVRVSDSKIAKAQALLDSCTGPWVSQRVAARAASWMMHSLTVIPEARLYAAPVYTLFGKNFDTDVDAGVVRTQLQQWIARARVARRSWLEALPPEKWIVMDASFTAIGGFRGRGQPPQVHTTATDSQAFAIEQMFRSSDFSEPLQCDNPNPRDATIMGLEAFATAFAVRNTPDEWLRGAHVGLITDNKVNEAALRKATAAEPMVARYVKEVWNRLVSLDCTFTVQWASTSVMGLADELSRVPDDNAKFLHQEYVHQIAQWGDTHGLPQWQVDAFTENGEALTPDYCSRWVDGPHSKGDFFACGDVGVVWVAHPPFIDAIIARMFARLQSTRARAYVIVPLWPVTTASPWRAYQAQAVTKLRLQVRPETPLFRSRQRQQQPVQVTPRFPVECWFMDFSR